MSTRVYFLAWVCVWGSVWERKCDDLTFITFGTSMPIIVCVWLTLLAPSNRINREAEGGFLFLVVIDLISDQSRRRRWFSNNNPYEPASRIISLFDICYNKINFNWIRVHSIYQISGSESFTRWLAKGWGGEGGEGAKGSEPRGESRGWAKGAGQEGKPRGQAKGDWVKREQAKGWAKRGEPRGASQGGEPRGQAKVLGLSVPTRSEGAGRKGSF